MAHYECKYCDRPAGYMGIPINMGDELICACGAEWEDAKILVEDEEIEDFEDDDDDEPRECWYCMGSGQDDLDEMGICKPCHGKGYE